MSKGKGKAYDPSSTEVTKMHSMDEVLGAKMLEVQSTESTKEEGEILSPKFPLIA